jgi:hypothetical protein
MSQAHAPTRSTPGEDAITAALRQAALVEYPALRDAVGYLGRVVIALRGAEGLLDTIRCSDALSLAAEAAADAAERLHKEADAGLLAALQESGAPSVRCNGHVLGTRENAATVDVVDRAAVPEKYLLAQEPRPDLPAIRKHIRAHPENWAVLRQGSTSLTRRSDEK